jgi:transporter family protein|uniref:EamA domain-containing protein n=1 Tax=candidate division WOR-3 bacterium TaxID=2052148 RepID=A0A7V3RFR2_UNCW3
MDYIKYAYIALIGWGVWAIGSKVLSHHLNSVSISFWISSWSLLFLLFYLLFSKDSLQFNHYSLCAIPIGFVSLIAILAFYQALKNGPASVVVPLTNLYVIFPVLYGFLILREPPTISRLLGIGFALAASILLTR